MTIPGDQNHIQYCNSIVTHNREEIHIATSSEHKSMSISMDQKNKHSSKMTKGKKKVVDSSSLSSLSFKYTNQKCEDGMSYLMQDFEQRCKIHHKGVGEYIVSLFNLPTSPKSNGK